MRHHIITTALLIAVTLMSACKKDDDDAPPQSGNGTGGVQVWTTQLLVIQGTDTAVLAPPQWQVASESMFVPSGVPDFWYALHEVVMTNTSNPTEQWRFGFIGNFLTSTGTGPTAAQTATMISLGTLNGGRWEWNAATMSYDIIEGARVQYIDAAGVAHTTGPTATMEVQQVQETGFSSGVQRQARLRSSGFLSGLGSRVCLYTGPVHSE